MAMRVQTGDLRVRPTRFERLLPEAETENPCSTGAGSAEILYGERTSRIKVATVVSMVWGMLLAKALVFGL